MLEKAIEIAVDGHKGQIDKFGNPYILHPLRVMFAMKTNDEKIVGVLHDVIEDTKYTFEDLRNQGFSDKILKALDCITNRHLESYDDFIERIKTNRIAVNVKIADMEDNMDIRRLKKINEKDTERLNKYIHYYRILKEALEFRESVK